MMLTKQHLPNPLATLMSVLLWATTIIAVHAQEATAPPAALAENTEAAAEQLLDTDLAVDLAAEALPTTDALAFWWERVRFSAVQTLTFNTERKAERFSLHLHQLDRKMAACAEIGDTECAQRIQQRIDALEERARQFMARREELQQDMHERFQAWRERREARHQEWQQQAAERRIRRQELLEEREAHREAAQERRNGQMQEIRAVQQIIRTQRQETREQRQNVRQDARQDRQEQRQEKRQNIQDTRQQNREQLIELRSQNVKNQLDATRARVEERNQAAIEAR